MTDRRRALLVAALGFVLLERWQLARELAMLHAWLDRFLSQVIRWQRHRRS